MKRLALWRRLRGVLLRRMRATLIASKCMSIL
jgi:hypothetical protein